MAAFVKAAAWRKSMELMEFFEDVETPTPDYQAWRRETGPLPRRVVLARYAEDVPNIWQTTPHVIYDKGAAIGKPLVNVGLNIVPVDTNKFGGREADTYLWHILRNYDHLDDYTVFLQANPWPHCKELAKDISQEADFAPICRFRHSDGRELYVHELGETLPIGEMYRAIFDQEPPLAFEFGAGAQFVVSRQRILERPIGFYSRILGMLDEKSPFCNTFAWTLERLWPHIFGAE